MYVKRLASDWMGYTESDVRTGVGKKIKSFAKGDLEHATEMLSELWEIANNDVDCETPSDAESIVSPFPPSLLLNVCVGAYNLHSIVRTHVGQRSHKFPGCGHGALEVDSRWILP